MSAQATTVRLTTAQALVRYIAALRVATGEPLFGGVFAIFGHGNVAGIGEALYAARDTLPTYRAHNEQAMAHSAIAYAKAHFRQRMMAVTTSIGPGATNLVTAAALAHVNRLPVLLLPGDIFVSRAPDPVLQQIEDTHDGGISANDALKPVSRYFDRIMHPAQLLSALPRAIRVLTDAALCGPVTLALPQDVQAMAYDYPLAFFAPRTISFHAPAPVAHEIDAAAHALREAYTPLIIAGGGVLYGDASAALRRFAERHGVPVAETQAGKSALAWDHPLNVGGIGVTGSAAANDLANTADSVLAVGSRLQDFTTGSNTLFSQARIVAVNANGLDALKQGSIAVESDAAPALDALSAALGDWRAAPQWTTSAKALAGDWRATVARVTGTPPADHALPREADVIGAVQRSHAESPVNDIVVCAAGTLPADLQKLWRAGVAGAYHVEYGYSCMGYEIAGGPRREARAAGPRSDRDRGRRQLSDDEQRAGHVRNARMQADRGATRQPRLWLHQPAATGVRRRPVQQSYRRLQTRTGRRALHRFRNACPRARRERRTRLQHQPTRSRHATRTRRTLQLSHQHRHGPGTSDGGRRLVVGSRGAGGLGTGLGKPGTRDLRTRRCSTRTQKGLTP